MIYQAKYFEKHPDSRFSILADNVKHPFNEYLGFLLQYGIVGTCFLILLFFIVMKDSIRRDRNASYELSALLSLFCIGVVGLFSYPLYYSSILILISIIFFLLIGLSETKIVVKIPTYILLIIFVPLSGFVSYDSVRMIRNERTWFLLKESFESDEMILHQYENLLLKQKFDNPWFLYNYGAMLNKHGLYRKSIEIMKKCEHHLNDADVQILFAENYLKVEDYTNAERCALLASQMCPNRFIPLYQLVLIYDATNRKEDAITLARKIMNKPIKVNSQNITLIKLKISKFLGQ